MFTYCGIQFPDTEKITNDTIFTCHPQRMQGELIGVPLRGTRGYQNFYDKQYRTFQGMTFYTKSETNYFGPPPSRFKYVLACMDGILKVVNGELCLIGGGKTIIYSHIKITRSSGSVKKGQIVGEVQQIPNGCGYGVSVRGFKGGSIWNIERDYYNIPNLE